MTHYKRISQLGLLSLALALHACVPAKPTRTTRPEVALEPWEERTVVSPDTSQEYRYLYAPGPTDEAPVLLMLPGGFFDHRIWLGSHDLSASFHLYALDWPNESPLFTGNPEDFVTLINDFLTTLKVEEVFIAGVSAGGFAGIMFGTHPSQIELKGLVMISSNVPAVTSAESRGRLRMAKFALRMKPDKLRVRVEKGMEELGIDDDPGDLKRGDIFYVRPYSYYEQMFSVAKNLGETRPPVERITCPVLVIHGTGDTVIDPELAEASAELFPNSRYVTVPNGGHSMVFTSAQDVVPLLREFLTKPIF